MPAFTSREEMMNALNAVVGENPSDEAVTFIANLSDTYDHHMNTINDTNKKYTELKKDYTTRFTKQSGNGGNPNNDGDDGGKPADSVTDATYETLFFDK